MKLERIVAVCTANAFRSPSIEACAKGKVNEIGEDIEVIGRGVEAYHWNHVIAGRVGMPEKYVEGAFKRAIESPENYSENIRNIIDAFAERAIVARCVLGEERRMYRLIIERFCDETGLPYPSGYHQQLGSDLKGAHVIVASEKERALIELPDERVIVLGITDALGGTYKAKKPVLEEIKCAVDEAVPRIIEQYS